ncbi:MFS transporter [Bacillus sp. ISL-57]|uniref:MFS transporter n=1 Tax=Bacillus sp. ISL-57 TaxID=2819135 RepID=UPI0020350EC7|nr:MFS transporter [Bacillus sp. ISL-57]
MNQSNNLNVVSRKQMITAISASIVGWAFDLFDLFILLFVAPTIGKLFFPTSDPMLQLAATYASFAVTLLMRPVGSALFGSYADRYGRKRAMIIAVVGVGVATALFGTLPTYGKIGIAATVLFIILRLIQGVFVGGVVASTHTIGTETVSPKYRGLMSGLIGGGGAGLGALMASIVFLAVTSLFPGPEFEVWGWRVMFFTGIISSIFGIFIFRSLEESPAWVHAQKENSKVNKPQKTPIRTLFSRQYLFTLIVNLLLTIGGGTAYYLTAGYLPTFLKVVNETSSNIVSTTLIITSIIMIISTAFGGYISDVIGRKKTFLISGVICLLGLPLLFKQLGQATDGTSIIIYASIIVFLAQITYAPTLIFLNERFPTAIRSTGTGLSWNLGFAIGGTMPTFVSLASETPQSIPVVLGYFFTGVFILYLIGSLIIPETKGKMVESNEKLSQNKTVTL